MHGIRTLPDRVESHMHPPTNERLRRELLRPDASVVFLTGAGISLASGIPTFRGADPDAVWAKDVLEMGTFAFFKAHPVEQWQWYLKRFDGCRTAKPNAAHFAITEIERKVRARGSKFLCVTQNVDGLHVDAGTKNLIEIHGAARRMRCSQEGCEHGEPFGSMPWDEAMFAAFRADPREETLPRCPACNAVLRAHVLWFDEMYVSHADYGWNRAEKAAKAMTCVVFVGTSFSVGITYMASMLVSAFNVPAFIIDPNLSRTTHPPYASPDGGIPGNAEIISEGAENYLPRLVQEL